MATLMNHLARIPCGDELLLGDHIRELFPIFGSHTNRLCYLDSAATSQKPILVLERLNHFLSFENANIHRGTYSLGANATAAYDQARNKVAQFLKSPSPDSIVFTKGTTEAINLVAHGLQSYFKKGDSVLLTLLEHHSNIVPWQLLAKRAGLKIHFVGITSNGLLDIEDLEKLLKKHKPKLLSVTALSNALGSIVPVDEVVSLAHKFGAKVLIDAAQAAAHLRLDVRALDCDFLAFSGHKIYGPTGIGALYAKEEMIDLMEPFQGGGDMIETVGIKGSTFATGPRKFEAGTQPIAEAIGLGSAIDFVQAIGFDRIVEHDRKLSTEAVRRLKLVPGVKLIGPASLADSEAEFSSIISFNLKGIHAHDLSSIADSFNVQIRGGTHCAMPLMNELGVCSTARISLGVYSDISDLDSLIEAIERAKSLFGSK